MHIIQSCYSVFNTRIYKFLLLLIVFVAIGLIPFPLEAREVISLNRDWLFHAGDVADGASAIRYLQDGSRLMCPTIIR